MNFTFTHSHYPQRPRTAGLGQLRLNKLHFAGCAPGCDLQLPKPSGARKEHMCMDMDHMYRSTGAYDADTAHLHHHAARSAS